MPSAIATSATIEVISENSTYTHGEFLSFKIIVDEIGENATIYIRDSADNKSEIPDRIPINSLQTEFIFPFSFAPDIYKEGKYFLDVEYKEQTDSIEFSIVNSNKKVITAADRSLIKIPINLWVNNNENERLGQLIKYLMSKNLIEIKNSMSDESIRELEGPEWIKKNAQWWVQGKVSDNDFVLSLQYLIEKKIITNEKKTSEV